jgi:IS30 family transposase
MFYFADPFASWQRRSNENYSGLLRRYIPKKGYSSALIDQVFKVIEVPLNHRPRKRL